MVINKILLTFFFQALGIFLTYLLHLYLAREMAPQDYGELNYIINILTILAIAIPLGLPNVLLKYNVTYRADNLMSSAKGLIDYSFSRIVIFSFFFMLGSWVTIFFFMDFIYQYFIIIYWFPVFLFMPYLI